MNDAELHTFLGKIGKRIFVQYFREFCDINISNQEMIAMLPSEYTFKSRTSRTTKSRRIFREGLADRALAMIAESDRVDPQAAREARGLLTERQRRPI